ncbi:MAG: mercury methylation corrinoid protein HgcA [bacterium]|nr:mercury methylation corrinoid protein HgcA [bacterium]
MKENSEKPVECCDRSARPDSISAGCCGGPVRPGTPETHFVSGAVNTPAGPVPRVTGELSSRDRWGSVKCRWGIGRMSYTVAPGLYALGSPDPDAPVLVTANYKMSFDRLREAMRGWDAWILVLNTRGINVWCAAGAGTFGTKELVKRIAQSRLAEAVNHRVLILPQLGAPGVAAHEVKKASGFKVRYGPIRATDLPAFLEAGMKATPEMRKKTFTLRERAVLIPIELIPALKISVPLGLAFFFLSGLGSRIGYWAGVQHSGFLAAWAFLLAVLGGAVLFPILLPWISGRAFSLKGFFLGLVMDLVFWLFLGREFVLLPGRLELWAWMFVIPALVSHMAMNFTGASTYTSLSGVKKEMRWALPLQIGGGIIGLALWIGARFVH